MATNGRVRGNATRATVPHLLKGLVFGNDGRAGVSNTAHLTH